MARTPKARALGAALRQAREDKGLLLREVASSISRDIGVLSRWETGDRTPKPEQVAQILTALGVHGEPYDDIMTLAYSTDESQWVATTLPEQRAQMAAYIDWESKASRIVEVAPLLIPGLLQTDAYVQELMTAARVPSGEIAQRVAMRMGRQQVLKRQNAPELLVFLGRAALYQEIGGRQTTIEQLEHLLKVAGRSNIELRIVPDGSGWHPGLEGPFAFIESNQAIPSPRLPGTTASIVFIETRRSVLMLHEDADVDVYRWAVDQILSVSLSSDASAKFIDDLRNRMEK